MLTFLDVLAHGLSFMC